MNAAPTALSPLVDRSDEALVALARTGDTHAFRAIMQRSNQRLFRVARAILGDDGDAEDAVQEAYLHAFRKLDGFRGEANVRTWLTSITVNEARGRLRKRRPMVDLDTVEQSEVDRQILQFPTGSAWSDPARDASSAEARRLLEREIDALPGPFRIVFVMREIEQFTTEQTAEALGLRIETVKTRLFRARRRLHTALAARVGSVLADAFSFDGARCDRITQSVIERMERKAATLPNSVVPPSEFSAR